MKLYIDDTRAVPFGFILVTSVDEAIDKCKLYEFNQISLDFNLGFTKKNGLDFIVEFFSQGFYVPHLNFHSDDSIGVSKMISEINRKIIEGEINKEIKITRISY